MGWWGHHKSQSGEHRKIVKIYNATRCIRDYRASKRESARVNAAHVEWVFWGAQASTYVWENGERLTPAARAATCPNTVASCPHIITYTKRERAWGCTLNVCGCLCENADIAMCATKSRAHSRMSLASGNPTIMVECVCGAAQHTL